MALHGFSKTFAGEILARDVKLLRTGQVDEVVWEFTRSEVTGKIGPVKELLDKLNKFGITVKINY